MTILSQTQKLDSLNSLDTLRAASTNAETIRAGLVDIRHNLAGVRRGLDSRETAMRAWIVTAEKLIDLLELMAAETANQ